MDDTARRVLEFEQRHYSRPGSKEQAIRDELGMGTTRYYQLLVALLEDPEAEAADPLLVHRLRRLRADRRAQRSARWNPMRQAFDR